MISFTQKGSFKNTERYLRRLKESEVFAVLNKYGDIGVQALSAATPRDTGVSAGSWSYSVKQRRGYYSIRWSNSDQINGTPLVIMLQYGHGTGTGGYVQGRDFINPAIRPIFEQMANEAWKEVTRI